MNQDTSTENVLAHKKQRNICVLLRGKPLGKAFEKHHGKRTKQ